MSRLWKLSNQFRVPIFAFCGSQVGRYGAKCEEAPGRESQATQKQSPASLVQAETPIQPGMQKDAVGDYHGLFPLRQLWKPRLEYPLWDANWDGKEPKSTGSVEKDRARARQIRKTGVTRHIILVRHGQYDETYKVSAV